MTAALTDDQKAEIDDKAESMILSAIYSIYEDAARIVDDANEYGELDTLAAAIRARAKEETKESNRSPNQ